VPLLQNRIALVTGASRGIGKAIALALAEAGANVAVNYRQQAESCGVRRFGHSQTRPPFASPSRRTSPNLAKSIASSPKSKKHLGVVDILVNNAGIASSLSPSQVTEGRLARNHPRQPHFTVFSRQPTARFPAYARPKKMGTHYQSLLRRRSIWRHRRPALFRVQGRHPRALPVLMLPSSRKRASPSTLSPLP